MTLGRKVCLVDRGTQVGNFHLEANFGTTVDVGHIFWYASGPGIPPAFDLGRREAFYDSETTTLLGAVRCCVTTTLAA